MPDTTKPVYMSYVSAVMSTCFVVGPLIGGGLAAFNIRVPFYAATVIAALGEAFSNLYNSLNISNLSHPFLCL